jgi:hypothetical protein
MGRTFSFSRSNSVGSNTSGASARITAGAGSQADSASVASTPRAGYEGGDEGPYNPYASGGTLSALTREAERKAEAAAAAAVAQLRRQNEELQAANSALAVELEATQQQARELHSRATVAEDSRSAASQVGARWEPMMGGKRGGCITWKLFA